jgi:predicted GIY-YIG superfamily endonuclease
MPHIVYALVDTRTNKEFYVGRTEDAYRRFIQHLRGEGDNFSKNAYIQDMRASHHMPCMKTLEIVEDAALAAQREAYWIRHFRYLGIGLTNDIVYVAEERKEDTGDCNVALSPQIRTRGSAEKHVFRILRRKPETGPSELGKLAGISKGHASRIKTKFLSQQS